MSELATNLADVRQRISDAAEACGRDPGEITLVVVTKTFPASDVRLLHELGVVDVGENRHQEAEQKVAATPDCPGLRWHFIGGLQSNKAAAVGRYAESVHSVDRPSLIAPLARAALLRQAPIRVFVQVSLDRLDGGPGRAGARPADLCSLATAIRGESGLVLSGLMAVAPLGEDPGAAFARLSVIRERFLDDFPDAHLLSAGMSHDLAEAIMAGATHVRVGAAVLGSRGIVK